MSKDTLRIGCASGFWGDTEFAAAQLVEHGDIDVLVFDYLAEITMSLLIRARAKDPTQGYAPDFVATMRPLMKQIKARGIRVVANAGGVNPSGCREALVAAAQAEGVELKIAAVLGDDLMPQVEALRGAGVREMFSGAPFPAKVMSANAYLGAFPIAAALAAGIAPAAIHLRSSARDALAATAAGAGSTRGRRGALGRLVVAQLALALLVVFAAALLGRSLERLLAEDPGFRPEGATVATVGLVGDRYGDDAAAHALFREAAERLAAMPGIEAAGWTSQLPLGGNFDTYTLRFEDRPEMRLEEEPAADRYAVTPGYFRALGLRLVEGRLLDAADDADGELVVLINRTLAETTWPGESALGKRLRMSSEGAPWRRVVGVVDDVRHQGLDRPPTAQFYAPAEQWFFADSQRVLVVRSSLPGATVAARVAGLLRELDPRLPVEAIRPMRRVLDESAGGRRFAAGVWSGFAALALLLAAIGTYGLLARQVALRRRELGVRAALGATPAGLRRDVARRTARLVLLALAVATPLCLAAGRLLAAQLWRVPPADVRALASAVVVVAATAALAALVPATRAARTDPSRVLRDD